MLPQSSGKVSSPRWKGQFIKDFLNLQDVPCTVLRPLGAVRKQLCNQLTQHHAKTFIYIISLTFVITLRGNCREPQLKDDDVETQTEKVVRGHRQ